MASIRSTALDALYARLETITGAALIKRNWNGAPSDSQMPAVIMMEGGEEVSDEFTHNYQISVPVFINLFLNPEDTDDLADLQSLWLQKVKEALLQSDASLGGTSRDLRYRGASDPLTDDDLGGSPFRYIGMQFELLIEHAETDPTVKV